MYRLVVLYLASVFLSFRGQSPNGHPTDSFPKIDDNLAMPRVVDCNLDWSHAAAILDRTVLVHSPWYHPKLSCFGCSEYHAILVATVRPCPVVGTYRKE